MFGIFKPAPQLTFDDVASPEAKELRVTLRKMATDALCNVSEATSRGNPDEALSWVRVAEECDRLSFRLPLDWFGPVK